MGERDALFPVLVHVSCPGTMRVLITGRCASHLCRDNPNRRGEQCKGHHKCAWWVEISMIHRRVSFAHGHARLVWAARYQMAAVSSSQQCWMTFLRRALCATSHSLWVRAILTIDHLLKAIYAEHIHISIREYTGNALGTIVSFLPVHDVGLTGGILGMGAALGPQEWPDR